MSVHSRTGHELLDVHWGHRRAISGLSVAWTTLASLIANLDDCWNAPTRCDAWLVRDVVGHLVGQAADVATGHIGARTPDDQAAEYRTCTSGEAAERLDTFRKTIIQRLRRAAPNWDNYLPSGGLTLAEGVVTLWHDALVHNDDIRDAIGAAPLPRRALIPSVAHLTFTLRRRGVAFAFEIDGVGTVTSDPALQPTRCTAREFVLVTTGRLDPSVVGASPAVNVYGT